MFHIIINDYLNDFKDNVVLLKNNMEKWYLFYVTTSLLFFNFKKKVKNLGGHLFIGAIFLRRVVAPFSEIVKRLPEPAFTL